MEEIKSLRERQYDLIQNTSMSHKALYESIKCDQCDILKNKIGDFQNTLDKFTKGTYNLKLLLGNQIMSYNKVGLGYEPKNYSKSFRNICNAQLKSKCKTLKYNYCNKDGHIAMFCFIKKSIKSKEGHPPSYFCKEHCEHKIERCFLIICITLTSKDPKVMDTESRKVKL